MLIMSIEKHKTRENHIKFLLGSFLYEQINHHPEEYHQIKTEFLHYMINKSVNDKKIAQSYFDNLEKEEIKEAEKRFEDEGGGVVH